MREDSTTAHLEEKTRLLVEAGNRHLTGMARRGVWPSRTIRDGVLTRTGLYSDPSEALEAVRPAE
jgi:hypothetical protein